VTFPGCAYCPWAQLTNIRWLQIPTLVTPLVYVSKGPRIALTPGDTHMPVWAVLGALLVLLAGLASLGTWLCIWRVID
jgi:ABC-2 type transport system permease protein